MSTKIAKKIARYSLTGLLVTGVILVTGFLSFVGALFLFGSIILGIVSFCLAGGIEGEVYAQNINNSFKKIFSKNYLEEAILANILDQLLKEEKNKSNQFLLEYEKQRQYVRKLTHRHDHGSEKQLQEAQKRLRRMVKYFKHYVYETSSYDPFHLSPIVNKVDIQNRIRSSFIIDRLSWILNILAASGLGLAGIEAGNGAIAAFIIYLGISISATAMMMSVFGIAIIGAIGYVYLIYNTITDMLANDIIRKILREIYKDFRSPNAKSVLKATSLICAVGLGIFAAVATAGTLWYAVKVGAKTIPYIIKFVDIIRTVVVSATGLTTLLFNIVNSFKAVKDLMKFSIRKRFQQIKDTLKDYWDAESVLQFINIPRAIILLITGPFTLLAFIGHLLSEAFKIDRLPGANPYATVGFTTAGNGLPESHFILGHDHQHGHEEEHQEFGEDHHHINLLGFALKIVLTLTLLYPLAIAWDAGCQWCSKGQKDLSFKDILKQSIRKMYKGMPEKEKTPPEEPELRLSDWIKEEKRLRIRNNINKHARKFSTSPTKEEIDKKVSDLIDNLNKGNNSNFNANTFFAGQFSMSDKIQRKELSKKIDLIMNSGTLSI